LVSQCNAHPIRSSKGISVNACNGAVCRYNIKGIGTVAATTSHVTARDSGDAAATAHVSPRDAVATAHATATTGCTSICYTATAIAATEGATAITARASN